MSLAGRAGAVVYVKDLARASAFYATLLDDEPPRTNETYVVLDTPACQVVLLATVEAARFVEIDGPPTRRTETAVKLVFPVDSIARVRAAAVALGGLVDPVADEWHFESEAVCDGHDPEGNVVQLREVSRGGVAGPGR